MRDASVMPHVTDPIEAAYAPPSGPTQLDGPALGLETTTATMAADPRQQGPGARYVTFFVGGAVELMKFWRGQARLAERSTAPAALALLASKALDGLCVASQGGFSLG